MELVINMDEVKDIYNNKKLLVRAMDYPNLQKGPDGLEYDCSIWANEFCMLKNGTFSSVSTTLIVPDVGVMTYKNIGFLIDSDLAECFHISKIDSSSRGNLLDGDFFASDADFQTISELANYIETSNDPTMNEVNINAELNAVKGLFFNECPKQDLLLQRLYVARTCLKDITGIEYPIYSYDLKNGKINYVELTDELEQQIIDGLKTNNIFYWPDDYQLPVTAKIEKAHTNTHKI
jgi:hypothetical protein